MSGASHPSSKPLTFKDIPVGAYFVWKRDCQLGPLLKANEKEAMDDSDRCYRIAPGDGDHKTRQNRLICVKAHRGPRPAADMSMFGWSSG